MDANKLGPTSFSQTNMYYKCPRCWVMQYIQKIPVISDMTYADAGNVLHKSLQNYYDGRFKNLQETKDFFNLHWKIKKLDQSKIAMKKDEYWLMVVNGINLGKHVTTTEMKIFYPDAVAYLDGVNTNEDEILDWKSSTRRPENEEEYKQQLMFYAYLYNRKFGRVPKKVVVYYLKYDGSKGELSFKPTEEDIKKAAKWHLNAREQMKEIIKKGETPPITNGCFMFCPFENICCVESVNHLKFTLHIKGNYVHVDGPITNIVHQALEKKFSYELKNAHWIKQAKPNANTTVKFWDGRNRRLPLGFISGLKKTLGDYAKFKDASLELKEKDYRVFDEKQIEMPEKFLNGIILRDYQTRAVDTFLRQKIGILEIGTGGGKTEIAIECIRRLGIRTLFIVDKIELMRQTKERIEKSLDISVGQIGQGITDIQVITVATVQTITKHLSTLAPYLRSVRFCIFDETHKVAARSYWRISQQLINSEYRLGISGTAFRDDGNDMMINASTGYKIFDLSSKKLIEEGWLVKPQVIFIKDYMSKEEVRTTEESLKTGLINETPNYTNFYKGFISGNPRRNLVIQNLITINPSKRILILTKLIEHGQDLQQLIPESEHLYGATNKKERKEMFDKFVKGEIKVLISTLSIFAEGINIPALDVVINASANKGNVKTIQVLGRVLRKLSGKENAVYYDFMDETRFFRLASLARKRILHKEGHNIEVKKWQQNQEMK